MEQEWTNVLPKEVVIPSVTFGLGKADVEFLIDDNTNPDLKHFSLAEDITQAIGYLKGAVFVKFGNRSAKDCSNLDRKVRSTR
jgi:hypothetical protein